MPGYVDSNVFFSCTYIFEFGQMTERMTTIGSRLERERERERPLVVPCGAHSIALARSNACISTVTFAIDSHLHFSCKL